MRRNLVGSGAWLWLLLAVMTLGLAPERLSARVATVYNGDPGNYRDLLEQLAPGDTLSLAAGTYTLGLPLYNLHGQPGAPITITGPSASSRVHFTARVCCNTVSLSDASYLILRHLELDGGGLANVDAVKAESGGGPVHHITLDNLFIHDHDANQQTVGISTKVTAWDWIIRNNIIDSAGTGLYLGDSNGSAPFINGLIEGNLVADTIGYNLQIKHQTGRPAIAPTAGSTIIRHNVFSKANNASTGAAARPNVLVGHWPLSGPGAADLYQIYGNFFFQNPTPEPLFQGEGNIALYANLFVADTGDGVVILPHNDRPRLVRVFSNTILVPGTGLRFSGGSPDYSQKATGNAIFAANSIQVPAGDAFANVSDDLAAADSYLQTPFAPLGQLDLYPLPGALTGPQLDSSWFDIFLFYDRDFNHQVNEDAFRGAYAGSGTNPGWRLALERPPLPLFELENHLYLPLISHPEATASDYTFSQIQLDAKRPTRQL